MDQPTDLRQITDIKELESLAYRQIKTLEISQRNLQMIEARIAEVSQPPAELPVDETTEKIDG